MYVAQMRRSPFVPGNIGEICENESRHHRPWNNKETYTAFIQLFSTLEGVWSRVVLLHVHTTQQHFHACGSIALGGHGSFA